MNRLTTRLASALAGATATAVVLAGTSGATHLGSLQLGHANTTTAQTSLTANLDTPVLKVVNQGGAAAVRGEAQNGIGTNGISIAGVGQQGLSQTGIGTLGTHGATTGVNPGVQGETNSTDPGGAGVVGKNMGGGPGLRAIVNAGTPPLAVNSGVKVQNLNADRLDDLDSAALQKRVTGTCGAGSAIKTVNTDGTVVCEPVGGGGAWSLTGNAGTTPGTNFLGTTDNQPLELKVNGQRALRIEPAIDSDASLFAPNLIGGATLNEVSPGIYGGTISGGGRYGLVNRVTDAFGTIGGGLENQAGNGPGVVDDALDATVAGGRANTASGAFSAVGGGGFNTGSGDLSVVGGGGSNTASGNVSAIAGGTSNTASGPGSTVAGGNFNTASGPVSTVAGGHSNTASGDFSFAAGRRAKATHAGSFVWGDSTEADITSPGANTFTVRASGGSRFQGSLHVQGALSTGLGTFPDGHFGPSVSGGNVFMTQNTTATTILGFADGVPGQTITIIFQDANTTVQNNPGVILVGGEPFKPDNDDTLTLVRGDFSWFEVSRSVNSVAE